MCMESLIPEIEKRGVSDDRVVGRKRVRMRRRVFMVCFFVFVFFCLKRAEA